ncbi:MAG: hydantoinase/oxoprolinase family protein [Massiliimalia sp.]|jgi:N-methylhydantoinase A/oxoprolinase/acetone carboxylase beta subunit
MEVGIGIDTGGTYTDAVIFDFEDGKILGTAKALTTKNNLSIGILEAIDQLPLDLARKAQVIALSTTLATNACVEDKGGRAKLFVFGGEQATLDHVGADYGLPPTEEIDFEPCETTFSGKVEQEPDWDHFAARIENGLDDLDGAAIVEKFAMRNGAVIEKKAKALFEQKSCLPVVCGHELFSELNWVQRASSTLLNARLFPVIGEFLSAVKTALAARKIEAPFAIVRSDGSLMSEKFSALRPVETLLCGPAASVIGSTHLTQKANTIVVDMGGTTTDIALVRDGVPVTVTNGVSIGKWKTYVDGLYVKTFGLGGDSAVHYQDESLYLEDYRVVPLCIAAQQHPCILDHLKNLKVRRHTRFLYEHYLLMRDIEETTRYTPEEKALCRALKEKPLLITDAAAAVGKDIYTLKTDRLIQDGIIQICGLTPTDMMHLKGDYDRYCTEASQLAAEFAAYNLEISVEELADRVYDLVKEKMYLNIVEAILENRYPDYQKNGIDPAVKRLIRESYHHGEQPKEDSLVSSLFRTDYALVGIGAPIHIFLEDVAKRMGTQAVIPQHHQVANALGAVMGSISAVSTIEIRPITDLEEDPGYQVFGTVETRSFEELEDAVEYACEQAKQTAKEEAIKRGAVGKISVTAQVQDNQAQARNCQIYLGTIVTARAVGTAGF